MAPWKPEGFNQAFILALTSLFCWGTWSNSAKAASKLPFAVYYMDFSVGVFLSATVGLVGPGALTFAIKNETAGAAETDFKISSSSASVGPVDPVYCMAAAGAGAVFNFANLLLVVAIKEAGLSIAFPLGIGIALVLGAVLTYFSDDKVSRGEPGFIFGGVALALVAVLCIAAAHAAKDRDVDASVQKKAIAGEIDDDSKRFNDDRDGAKSPVVNAGAAEAAPLLGLDAPRRSTFWKIRICVLAGCLMSAWNPLSVISLRNPSNEGGTLTVYSSFLIYAAAVVAVAPFLLSLQQRGIVIPQAGGTEFANLNWWWGYGGNFHPAMHMWGLGGGFMWGTGTLCSLLSGNAREFAYAPSYAIGQSAPLVATLWGIFYYKEFEGTSLKAKIFLAMMFLCYGGAVAMIANSGESTGGL